MAVTVKRIDAGSYEVTVEGRTTTTHTVTLIAPYYHLTYAQNQHAKPSACSADALRG